jgi:hypothetical protein
MRWLDIEGTTGAARTPTPTTAHPQSSRCVPISCCGVACVRADHQGLEKQHDVQAACEPGGGGCGGVPVHPLQLRTHRTSLAQALLTILVVTC